MSQREALTIWGKSKESLPMVLKTKSCNLLTVASRSSPRAAMTTKAGRGNPYCDNNKIKFEGNEER